MKEPQSAHFDAMRGVYHDKIMIHLASAALFSLASASMIADSSNVFKISQPETTFEFDRDYAIPSLQLAKEFANRLRQSSSALWEALWI